LNEIIWASVKGFESKQPPTPRGPKGLKAADEEEDEDDD
jgi:hypothetical protein